MYLTSLVFKYLIKGDIFISFQHTASVRWTLGLSSYFRYQTVFLVRTVMLLINQFLP